VSVPSLCNSFDDHLQVGVDWDLSELAANLLQFQLFLGETSVAANSLCHLLLGTTDLRHWSFLFDLCTMLNFVQFSFSLCEILLPELVFCFFKNVKKIKAQSKVYFV
jgi:hypothetical protein